MKFLQIFIGLVLMGAVWYFWGVWALLAWVLSLGYMASMTYKTIDKMTGAHNDEMHKLQNEIAHLKQQKGTI